jgi:DNA-binding beta-propeller fold protein YncE
MRKSMLAATVASSALVLTAPLSALASGSGSGAAAAPAAAAHAPHVKVVNSHVILPFNLAVSHGRVYVADGATHTVSRVRGQKLTTVAVGETGKAGEGDVAGLAISRDGRRLAFTNTVDESHAKTTLEILGPLGKRVSADLSGFEARVNPDKNKLYGIPNPNQCVKDFFADHADEVGPVNYRGQKDSHPYSVASVGKHWVVADAGGNDLVRVSASGKVSKLAVLPRQPLKITAAVAKALGAPSCAVGFTYYWEPVPTDVEVGPHGMLYVSILAGGPESPALGARSKVYRVNPRTGKATKVGSKLSGATNIALKGGKVYVAELFGGRISVLRHGRPHTYVKLANAVSLESARHGFYAGTLGNNGPGTVVRIR